MKLKLLFVFTFLIINHFFGFAQKNDLLEIKRQIPLTEEEEKKWSYLDIEKDSIAGISLEKAIDFLKDKKPKNIIVAINDSGLDYTHKDLQNTVWKNSKEKIGNNKDDDGNGFVDDLYGWNFIGDCYYENFEITRMLKKFYEKYGKEPNVDKMKEDEKILFEKLKSKFSKEVIESKMRFAHYKDLYDSFKDADEAIKLLIGKDVYTVGEVEKLTILDVDTLLMKKKIIKIFEKDSTVSKFLKDLKGGVDYYNKNLLYYYNLDFDGRKKCLNDDGYNYNSKVYGNPNIKNSEEDESHGTHVAGIVAAEDNDFGMVGIAPNVKIMSVRVVPNGDEYDKDIALGIKYAVDNGAKIINTSFGKSFSPDFEYVQDILKYAEEKDVLIVNAAGNEAQNIDEVESFLNDHNENNNDIVDNVITIGASTMEFNENLVAPFSNYGVKNVDLFAPGERIYSTVPDNKFKFMSGTSMAAPTVTGVAALIRSYYPNLSASQVKKILIDSGVKVNFKVKKPGSMEELVNFDQVSASGRILNAYNAIILSDKISKE